MRINRFLSSSGAASRRKADEFIGEGRVTVDGRRASLGETVSGEEDIRLDGERISLPERVYFVMNKPSGFVTSMSDRHARSVMELAAVSTPGIRPVGRLDKDTRGLLFLTNDGEWAERALHPRFGHERGYVATLDRPLSRKDAAAISKGVRIGDLFSRPILLKRGGDTDVTIRMGTGRNREVRRLFEKFGYTVVDLVRTTFGPVGLEGLKEGMIRPLSKNEIEAFAGGVSDGRRMCPEG